MPRCLHELVTEVVALARNGDTRDEAIILQAHAVIGQLVVFPVGQPILLRRIQWDQFTAARIQQIIDVIVPSIQRSLGLPELSAAITQS